MASVPASNESFFHPPIVYYRARAFLAAFACPGAALERLLPDPRLRPIQAWPGAGLVVAAVFDYQDSSIGPYTSVAIAIPVRYRKSTAIPLLPLLAERWLGDVGEYIVTLPVTTDAAVDSAESVWGYPAYKADIDLQVTGNRVSCVVSERDRAVMHIDIHRPGTPCPKTLPLRTYSRKEDELLFTETEIDGRVSIAHLGLRASLRFDPHPRNEALADLPVTYDRPLEVRWFDEYRLQIDRPRAHYRIGY